MEGKALWQECEAAGHMTSIVRKQGECWYSVPFLLLKIILNYLFIFVHMCAHEFVCMV